MTAIILATYNGEAYLDEQLDSIFQQSSPPSKILVRDDGSLDRTVAILKRWQAKYPQMLHLLESDRNLGIIGNFSSLLSHVQAKRVALADQDDVWEKNKLETLEAALESQEALYPNRPHLVHSDAYVVDRNLNTLSPSFMRYSGFNPLKPILGRLLTQNHVTGCTTLINAPLIQKALPLPQESPMHDHWLALVAAAFGTIRYVDQPLIRYRQHGRNDTGAVRYSLFSLIQRMNDSAKQEKMRILQLKKVQQAKIFLERYQSELQPFDRETLQAFLEFKSSSLFNKIRLLWKYDLRKAGFLRQLGDLLLT